MNFLKKPKYYKFIEGANYLSLGLSMVVAILMGVAIGYGLKKLTHISWLFWLGVIWGVLASFLNIYKAYKNMQKDYEELAKDPKYTQNKTK
ncbi:AtpZ/AtpI family protein [Helicobacter pylori]